MAGRRTADDDCALIPLWGVVAFLGLQQFAGTRYEAPFLVLVGALFVALFSYVATHVVKARRQRNLDRKAKLS